MSQRSKISDAAIALLAAHGLAALTHRAVDRELGLPEGTTTNYHRTKRELLAAVVARLEERDRQELELSELPRTPEGLVDALLEFIELALGAASPLVLARLALLANLANEPGLAEQLQGVHLRLLDGADAVFGQLGATAPRRSAEILTDYLDGLLIHMSTVPGRRPEQLEELRPQLGFLVAVLCR